GRGRSGRGAGRRDRGTGRRDRRGGRRGGCGRNGNGSWRKRRGNRRGRRGDRCGLWGVGARRGERGELGVVHLEHVGRLRRRVHRLRASHGNGGDEVRGALQGRRVVRAAVKLGRLGSSSGLAGGVFVDVLDGWQLRVLGLRGGQLQHRG